MASSTHPLWSADDMESLAAPMAPYSNTPLKRGIQSHAHQPLVTDIHAFHAQLTFVIASFSDDDGYPWVSCLAGTQGFVQQPDLSQIEIRTYPMRADPLLQLDRKRDATILCIGQHTCWFNSLEGHLSTMQHGGFRLEVARRTSAFMPALVSPFPFFAEEAHPWDAHYQYDYLDEAMIDLLRSASMLYIALASHPGSDAAEGCISIDLSMCVEKQVIFDVEDARTLVMQGKAAPASSMVSSHAGGRYKLGLLVMNFQSHERLHVVADAEPTGAGQHDARSAPSRIKLHVKLARRVMNALPLRAK